MVKCVHKRDHLLLQVGDTGLVVAAFSLKCALSKAKFSSVHLTLLYLGRIWHVTNSNVISFPKIIRTYLLIEHDVFLN